ncbi:unnamed protein product [Prorocentrum cordatum]|uniref:Acylphosphatase n=1 Tax=Prorocentrum cordatum TaxID=2364126 RepID=A0ABN9TSW1_9DINO|nr:unnamed protein product [Polarella glacialis]
MRRACSLQKAPGDCTVTQASSEPMGTPKGKRRRRALSRLPARAPPAAARRSSSPRPSRASAPRGGRTAPAGSSRRSPGRRPRGTRGPAPRSPPGRAGTAHHQDGLGAREGARVQVRGRVPAVSGREHAAAHLRQGLSLRRQRQRARVLGDQGAVSARAPPLELAGLLRQVPPSGRPPQLAGLLSSAPGSAPAEATAEATPAGAAGSARQPWAHQATRRPASIGGASGAGRREEEEEAESRGERG